MNKNILNQFKGLSIEEKQNLLDLLNEETAKAVTSSEFNKSGKPDCMYCHGQNVIKYGMKEGVQRFRCTDCRRLFSSLTGKALNGLHKKHLWLEFIKLTLNGCTVREICKELNISNGTSFTWRHRLLSTFNEIFTKKFQGYVEVDDVNFTLSDVSTKRRSDRRGPSKLDNVAVLVTVDRSGTVDMKVGRRGKLRVVDVERLFPIERVSTRSVIATDSNAVLLSYFRQKPFQHEAFLASKHSNADAHANTLNNLKFNLDRFIMGNYHTVSTKYLQNYLNLYMMVKILSGKSQKEAAQKALTYCLSVKDGLKQYENIQARFKRFMDDSWSHYA